jgi:hypothetical protein
LQLTEAELAEEQDWLDGERSPVDPNAGLKAKGK